MATITKLPSGKWRIRKTYKGKTYSLITDIKPRKSDADRMIFDMIDSEPDLHYMTLEEAGEKYIRDRAEILRPSTIINRRDKMKAVPEWLRKKPLSAIKEEDVQAVISSISSKYSRSTVVCIKAVIKSIFTAYRPNMPLRLSLPPKEGNTPYIPTEEDVKKIVAYFREHYPNYLVAIHLACMGLRKGEIAAITPQSVDEDGVLHIREAMSIGFDGKPHRSRPKTSASIREFKVPPEIAEEIKNIKKPILYKGIRSRLQVAIKALEIPHFSIHKFRHYFASHAHSLGVPDAYIMAMGGWISPNVMQSVYRHAEKDRMQTETQKIIDSVIL